MAGRGKSPAQCTLGRAATWGGVFMGRGLCAALLLSCSASVGAPLSLQLYSHVYHKLGNGESCICSSCVPASITGHVAALFTAAYMCRKKTQTARRHTHRER